MADTDGAQIIMYTLPGCPHCARARALLKRRGLAFREVSGRGVPEFRQQIAALTGGWTVPQIVIDEEPIGGADRLAALDRSGVLRAIIAREPFPIDREIRRVTPASLRRWAAARIRGRTDVPASTSVHVKLDRSGQVVRASEAERA